MRPIAEQLPRAPDGLLHLKTWFVLLALLLPCASPAEMIGSSAASSQSKVSESPLLSRPKTAVNMLEPWHKNRPRRGAEWEEQLTFSEGQIQSVDELRRLLKKNNWRTIYHCNGRPAENIYGIYNGITLPFTYAEFGEHTVERRYAFDPSSEKAVEIKERSTTVGYSLKQLGTNRFQISYDKANPDEREIKLLKVNETNEWVFRVGMYPKICEDGSDLVAIWAPFQTGG